jgi:DNA-binding NarL/FixJ family response regulator
MISAVVVDDHSVVIAGVRTWCAMADPPIEVVASGATLAVAWLDPGCAADVVVLDLQLDRSGPAYADLKRLVDAGRRVVVYSGRADRETVLNCVDIGAFTYLTKAEGEEHLVAAIQAAAAGDGYTPPMLSGAIGTDDRPHRPRLSPREKEVLLEWFHCESKEMVAKRLSITVSRVNQCLERARLKYAKVGRDAPTKASLVARLIQDGHVSVDEL